MSKSLGNVLSIGSLLERTTGAALRYALSTPHYRSNIELGEESLAEAASAYERLEGFVERPAELGGEAVTSADLGAVPLPEAFVRAMDDDLGTWFVWDPKTKQGGLGSAYPDSRLKGTHFTDGTGHTLGFAEVKAYQAGYSRAGKSHAELATLPTPADICSWGGASFSTNNHAEWVDGRANHSGFTTVFRPNQVIKCINSGVEYDVDWSNYSEGRGLAAASPVYTPTYAANTARSYFSGAVNVSMMDGSVRTCDNTIDLGVWRAISTRASKELLPDSFDK
jgi:hypothetical protein